MDEEVYSNPAVDKRLLKALARRSDAQGLAQLLWHGAMLLASGLLVWRAGGSFWLAPAVLVHAVVLVFLFAPLHESVHRTAFRQRWLNDAVAWICGAVLLLPPEYFRAFHFAHHRHTQDPDRDPELAGPRPDSLRRYLMQASGLLYWRQRLGSVFRHAFTGRVSEPFIAAQLRPAIVHEARWLLSFYALLLLGSLLAASWALVTYWLLPVLIGQPFLRLYLMAEHGGCPLVADMLRNSRTTRSNALVRRLAWNMPYHAEHHAYPALPFHALPAAHRLLADEIEVRAPSYLAVHRALLSQLLAGRANG